MQMFEQQEEIKFFKDEIPSCPIKIELKTTINSEGKEVVQGKWI